MDTRILRLLIVDASPDDTELTLATLRKGEFLLKPQRVHDVAGLQAAVEKGGWDAAITERTLPHFGAQAVLDALRHANLEIPVLVLTRAIPDNEMTTLMRAGARDVILKNQMARLLPALERELAVAAERVQHRAAMQTLKEIEDKHRAVVDGAREAICYSHDGMHIDANKAYLDMFEYESVADLEGVPIMNLIAKSDQARFKQYIRKTGHGSGAPEEFTAVRKGGAPFHAEIAISPITLNGEACTQILVTDISKRKAVETKLQYLNQHDALTGLHNRPHFMQTLQQALESAKREKTTHGVIYVDFQDLHHADKALGPTAVDRLLLAAARALREVFGPRALLARYGDHEFSALVHDTRAAQLAELTEAAENAFHNLAFGDSAAPMKCNCRVISTHLDAQSDSAHALMTSLIRPPAASIPAPAISAVEAPPLAAPKSAPIAAKAGAESTPSTSPKPMLAAVVRPGAADWPQQIRSAIEREAFRLIYQPIVNLHADAAEYFEVLVRMVADDGKLIPAGLFMPPAEQSGQVGAIDRWVVKHSIRALAELHRQRRKVTFFVNLSSAGLADVELVVAAQQALHETGLKGKYVVFEIEESALSTQSDAAMAFMRAANKIGCRFCVDNFGRALGATTRLREPPIEYLKLDGTLVQNAARDNIAQASLKAVVEVAKAMEKKTIAKSVESAESLSVLWTLGVDYVQGHYFQEADAELNYEFGDETTLSADATPHWTVASSGKSR